MLYIHGGGHQMGAPEQAHDFFADLLKRRDVAIIAPAYRLSLDEHPFPAGLNDCFDALTHMKQDAAQLEIKDSKFIVAARSGGGGLTAALTLKVTGTKAADIAFQMPIYPIQDHRMQTKSACEMSRTTVWYRDSNALAWENYLGHLRGDVPDDASLRGRVADGATRGLPCGQVGERDRECKALVRMFEAGVRVVLRFAMPRPRGIRCTRNVDLSLARAGRPRDRRPKAGGARRVKPSSAGRVSQ